ncbi:MAG: DUF1553 domain-containing protein [Lewinellaceae bacterium]|nr:DUF1553 domain-containing protein [Lewinellaceae bacterium]
MLPFRWTKNNSGSVFSFVFPAQGRVIRRVVQILIAGGLIAAACQRTDDRISYNRDIRPIFNKKCLPCHGGVKKLGGFSLLFREEALGSTDSGKPAIVPGSHKKSELYHRLTEQDPGKRMPQESDPLSAGEIRLIARWLDEGAQWEEPWSYIPPKETPAPKTGSDWPQADLDRFVLKRLEQEGLKPEAPAEPATLIRRVSLDLTGLPPTPEMVEAFTADPSEKTYASLVDSLLASPHFGERWAAWWLDLARYADSQGYEKDGHRNIWQFRDWVIGAFNRDLPFDEFTIEQIAGDLLPAPTRDQLVATAFHRNTMTNTEGGTDDEEFRTAAVIDRLTTTFDVWQSTTIGCVQCHSHPYDPIRHDEFYSLLACFNNTQDADLDNELPRLDVYKPEDSARIQEVIGYINRLKPGAEINGSDDLNEQIRSALFPRLFPRDCDDFLNVMLQPHEVSNWSYNLQAGLHRRYFYKYDQIDLNGLEQIGYRYSASGDGARMDVRLDSIGGPVIQSFNFPPSIENGKQAFKTVSMPVQLNGHSGRHSLIFEIVNTIQKAPDGIVSIRETDLKYADAAPDNPERQQSEDELTGLRNRSMTVPIMREKSPVFSRQTHVFERGNFLVQGKVVQPATPGALPPLATGKPARLALAEWLVSEKNPLTARVMVNRIWEQLFGNGLVQTLEDFGTQGEPPTHPEMLDHLAWNWMHQQDWRVKTLIREIVLSATYRQSSAVSPEKQEKDPFNHLLSRGPRFRLSAEQVRDQALAVSGLLYDTIGGPSVMPPQPDGVWQVVYNGSQWVTETGKNRYRRALYTYWRRTTPYPSMMAFDAPSREFCLSRRIRTNTPLQALVTLNDPVFLEAATALAGRMKQAGGGDPGKAISAGYRMALARKPDDKTLAVLMELYQNALKAEQQKGPMVIPTGLNDAKPARLEGPMAVVANAILNLDGFLTKS